MKSEGVGLIVRAISFHKISNLCGPDPPTLQPDRRTTCDGKTALKTHSFGQRASVQVSCTLSQKNAPTLKR